MIPAVQGVIRGNTVMVEDADIALYDGRSAIVTILDMPKSQGTVVDRRRRYMEEMRGASELTDWTVEQVEDYIRESRTNDRF